ncbi:hypothetical protein CVT25_004847, partial [Psilocybe cyanescens]
MEISADDQHSELSVEVLEELPLGSMSYSVHNQLDQALFRDLPEPEWRQWRPDYPRKELGYAPGIMGQYILNEMQPYPEDARFMDQVYSDNFPLEDRFRIYQLDNGLLRFKPYLIVSDDLTGFQVKLSRSQLENLHFNITRWYIQKQLAHFNLPADHPDWIGVEHHMGSAWAEVRQFLLADGITSSYPNMTPDMHHEDRFWIGPSPESDDFYLIEDHDLDLRTSISKSCLENDHINLVEWYNKELTRSGNYAMLYEDRTIPYLEDVYQLSIIHPEPDEP